MDENFNLILKELVGKTLVDTERLYILWQFELRAFNIPSGFAAEVGVYKGGTAKLISTVLSNTTLYAFDTFEGMPEVSRLDNGHRKGDFSDTSIESVRGYLKNNSVQLIKGTFPSTAGVIEGLKFKFVHIDADIYSSVLWSCNVFYPQMVSGGVIIFDDYGFPSCEGARLAVDKFFESKKEQLIYLPTGQSLMIKENDV